jgi:hypothetical protein
VEQPTPTQKDAEHALGNAWLASLMRGCDYCAARATFVSRSGWFACDEDLDQLPPSETIYPVNQSTKG